MRPKADCVPLRSDTRHDLLNLFTVHELLIGFRIICQMLRDTPKYSCKLFLQILVVLKGLKQDDLGE